MVGIRGTHEDAKNVMNQVSEFLESKLNININKVKINIIQLQKEKALFLGTLIGKKRTKNCNNISLGRVTKSFRNGIRFEAPMKIITKKLISAGFIKNERSAPRFLWMANSKDQIINYYNSVIRGYLKYYSYVYNYHTMAAWVYMNLKSSCAKLLAAKYNLRSQNKVYKKFGKDLKGRDKIKLFKINYKIKPWDV